MAALSPSDSATRGDETLKAIIRAAAAGRKLGVADVSATCEEVGFELGATEGISPFGAVTYGFRTGDTTVFVGGKAGAEVPGTTIGLSAHDGVYVTFDSTGKVADAGIRVAVDADAGVTENINETQGLKVNISIVNRAISM